MPAAAVIPAPIAYIKVVAVKKLVVEFGSAFFPFCCCSALCCSAVGRGGWSAARCVLPRAGYSSLLAGGELFSRSRHVLLIECVVLMDPRPLL